MGARGTVGNDGGKECMGCSRKEVQIFFFLRELSPILGFPFTLPSPLKPA